MGDFFATDFFAAIGLMLVLEGLSFAAFPESIRQAAQTLKELPDTALRTFGLLAALAGLAVVWLVRG